MNQLVGEPNTIIGPLEKATFDSEFPHLASTVQASSCPILLLSLGSETTAPMDDGPKDSRGSSIHLTGDELFSRVVLSKYLSRSASGNCVGPSSSLENRSVSFGSFELLQVMHWELVYNHSCMINARVYTNSIQYRVSSQPTSFLDNTVTFCWSWARAISYF